MASNEDDQTVADGEEGEGKPKKGKKLILIVAVLVLLLGGGGAGVYFSGMLDKKPEEGAAEGEAPEGEHGEAKPKKEGEEAKKGDPVFHELPGFINNLNTGSTQASLIKVTVILEIPDPEDLKRIEQMQPRIMDDFNTYLRELRSSDLAGSAGLERLREELLRRVNKAVGPAEVSNILFKEIIVQ